MKLNKAAISTMLQTCASEKNFTAVVEISRVKNERLKAGTTKTGRQVFQGALYQFTNRLWSFGRRRLDPDAGRCPYVFVVRVKQPEIEHKVRAQDFENWLAAPAKSPAEMALKNRLRKMLGR